MEPPLSPLETAVQTLESGCHLLSRLQTRLARLLPGGELDRDPRAGLPDRKPPVHAGSMRAVIQRVRQASVTIGGVERDQIGPGLLVLVAAEETDTPEDVVWLSGKIARLRIFSDAAGLMNQSVLETGGEVMVISQFTLFASTRKGNRPSFTRAARPEQAIPLYHQFLAQLGADTGRRVACGEFGADMQVGLVNDGPVTIIIDSRQRE